MMEVVVTTGAVRRATLQSNCHHQQANTQIFTDRMPFRLLNQECRSTDGVVGRKTDKTLSRQTTSHHHVRHNMLP